MKGDTKILNQFDLSEKVSIVTGCSGGLGKQMAIALAEAGSDIVGAAHSNIEGLNDTKKEVERIGRKFVGVLADLTKIEDINKVIDAAVQQFGKIDVVVNNAGAIRRAPALEFTEKDWDEVMDLNSKALFFISQKAAEFMKENAINGKIINIASLRVFQGGKNVISYSASKGAVASITKSMANELSEFGIRVNAIAPGYMATDITLPYQKNQKINTEIVNRTPLKRWGKPEDLGGPVVFLASAASDFITGEILVVDGGWLVR